MFEEQHDAHVASYVAELRAVAAEPLVDGATSWWFRFEARRAEDAFRRARWAASRALAQLWTGNTALSGRTA